MAALDIRERPPVTPGGAAEWIEILKDLLAPDADLLRMPVETVAHYLRLLAFSSSLPLFNLPYEFGVDELANIVTYGVVTPAKGKD